MRKIELTIAFLILLTIFAIGISIYSYSHPPPNKFYLHYYQAIELREKPKIFFALNESHVYAVEAINMPDQVVGVDLQVLNETTGEWIDSDGLSDTFQYDANKYGTHNVEYQGEYYLIEEVLVEPPFDASYRPIIRKCVPAAWIILTILWAGVLIIILHNRKTQKAH